MSLAEALVRDEGIPLLVPVYKISIDVVRIWIVILPGQYHSGVVVAKDVRVPVFGQVLRKSCMIKGSVWRLRFYFLILVKQPISSLISHIDYEVLQSRPTQHFQSGEHFGHWN